MCMKDLNSPYQLAVDGSVSQFTFIDIDCGKLRLLPYVASCVCVCMCVLEANTQTFSFLSSLQNPRNPCLGEHTGDTNPSRYQFIGRACSFNLHTHSPTAILFLYGRSCVSLPEATEKTIMDVTYRHYEHLQINW
jgi:hypothetical protein